MQQVLKAWKQNPDDWRIRYDYRPQRKPGIIKRIITTIKAIFNSALGIGLVFIIASSIGAMLAGMS
jgi:hypothetical protein